MSVIYYIKAINVKDEMECVFLVCIISMANQCHQFINAINDYRKRDKFWPNGSLGLFADFTVRTFLRPYYFFSQFTTIWSIV